MIITAAMTGYIGASQSMPNSAQVNGSSKIAMDGKESFAYYLSKFKNRKEEKEKQVSSTEQQYVNYESKKSSLLSVNSLFKGAEDGVITLDELKENLEDELASYRENVSRLFKEYGIDNSTKISLRSGYDGYPYVANNHPDKEKIEKMFREHPELTNSFNKISSLATIIKAGQEASAFQKAYAINPRVAVEQFAYLFNKKSGNVFEMNINGDDIGYSVNREFVW